MKNKLPRKRKKAMIKAEDRLSYIAAQVVNDFNMKEKGHSDFRFPKLKHENNKIVIIGYW
jgi:hypothetical protein